MPEDDELHHELPEECCAKCNHFQPGEVGQKGICRRYPPRPYRAVDFELDEVYGFKGQTPVVAGSYYCGEFKKLVGEPWVAIVLKEKNVVF